MKTFLKARLKALGDRGRKVFLALQEMEAAIDYRSTDHAHHRITGLEQRLAVLETTLSGQPTRAKER